MLSTRLERVIEFMVGCGLLVAALLALRVHRLADAGGFAGINPEYVAECCQERQDQVAELFGR